MKASFDIIVVGAGMIGLACALALAKQHWQVLLIESQQSKPETLPTQDDPFDIRVVAISRASEKFFKELGVWSLIKETRSCAYQHMEVWDNEADGRIHFNAADFLESNLGYIIEQRVIKAALWQKILAHPEIEVRRGQEVTALEVKEDQIVLTLSSGSALQAKLAIAADGASSTMRKLCQIAQRGWDYQQSALVATVKGTKSHCQTAFQRFASDGPLALLPLSDGDTSSIVFTTTTSNANLLASMPLEEFNTILTRESGGVMGEMITLSERKVFPLQTHHAKDYAISRCVLVGDAAHTIHPLAGQGVNLGFKDVHCLMKVLQDAKARKRDIGALPLLKRYQRQRKGDNQIMIWAMEAFKRGFGSRNASLMLLRNGALNFTDKQLWLKQFFAKMALG